MTARGSCWTCTDRHVRCDGEAPSCRTCVRLRLHCQGYGMRLSWPSGTGSRRAIVGSAASTGLSHQARSHDTFINTTWADVTANLSIPRLIQPSVPDNIPVLRLEDQTSYAELLQYFHQEAYQSLSSLDRSEFTPRLRDVLLRLATSHQSEAALSAFFSLLAYSSLHRHGLYAHTIELKITAVRLLTASLASDPSDVVTAAQQVASAMLLTAFDSLSPSADSQEWLRHIWGANDLVRTARLESQDSEDANVLIGWVYYHNVLSGFALGHWRDELLLDHTQTRLQDPNSAMRAKCEIMPVLERPRCEILTLLSEACSVVRDMQRSDSRFMGRVDDLLQRSQRISAPEATATVTPFDADAIELFRLTITTYLVRASQRPTESVAWLDSQIDSAFETHIRSGTCPHFFPVMILACEARDDERRLAILEMLERSKGDGAIRSIDQLKDVIRALWAQQDLNSDVDLLVKYTSLLDTAISSSVNLPSFA